MAAKLNVARAENSDAVAGAARTMPVDPADIHIVGLVRRKPGPGAAYQLPQYTVVTGTVAQPVLDSVAQPLGYTSESLKLAVLKLLETIK